ncbi:MAG: hypothetical protein ACXIUZ_09350 [Lysobacteraceae bacterium]
MKKNRATLAAACSAALLFSGVALAAEPVATLSDVDGTVLIEQGDRFVTASARSLDAGARVLLMTEASARLSFVDGCEVELDAETLVTLPAVSPCAGGDLDAHRVGRMTAQAGEGGSAIGPETWVVFGAGAVALAYFIIDSDSVRESPVPPVSP